MQLVSYFSLFLITSQVTFEIATNFHVSYTFGIRYENHEILSLFSVSLLLGFATIIVEI